MPTADPIVGLPSTVSDVLQSLVTSAADALADNLVSIVLYGSAAEGQHRPLSDVNLIFVLRTTSATALDALLETIRVARAAANVRVMFLPEHDAAAAANAFAIKFADIRRRRKILFGADPFANLPIPSEAIRRNVQQVLLNFELRTRAAYVANGLREEQLARVVGRSAGPLRTAAAGLLELRNQPQSSPKAALQHLASQLPSGPWAPVLDMMTRARRDAVLPPGEARIAIDRLIALAREIRQFSAAE